MSDQVQRSPTFIEKKILVWTGKYPTEASIPETIPFRTMVRAKDLARVYLAGAMGVVVAGAFLYTAVSSKKLLDKGNSVLEMNKNWHSQYNKTGEIIGIHDLPKDLDHREQKST